MTIFNIDSILFLSQFWTYLDWAYPIPLGGPFITLSTILAEPFFFFSLDFGVLVLVAHVLPAYCWDIF